MAQNDSELSENDTIERGIEQIVKLCNQDILGKKSDKHKAKVEGAIRGIITAYKDKAVEEARADEIKRICDEVGLFTKPRNKAVYNVYLPIEYLITRVATLKANRLKGEKLDE